jgi:hypothetical protein
MVGRRPQKPAWSHPTPGLTPVKRAFKLQALLKSGENRSDDPEATARVAPSTPPESENRHRGESMRTTRSIVIEGASVGTFAVAILGGCGNEDDPISKAAQADKKAGIAAPGILETKAIAEQAFIFALPIVMNYAVMNEFCVDKNSAQSKGQFNQIANKARVFTYTRS